MNLTQPRSRMTMTTRTRILGVFGIVSIGLFVLIRWYNRPEIDYRVIELDKAWGYEILVNEQVVIHQETIPAIDSLMGFPNKEAAERTASYLVKKIARKETPRLTINELEKLGLIPQHPHR